MVVDSLPVLAALNLVPRPHPPALTRRNGLVNQGRISWASVCFINSVT